MTASAHKIEEAPEKRKSSFWDGLWFPFIFTVISIFLRDLIPFPVAAMATSIITGCIAYKIDKPKISFLNYFLKFQAVMLLTILAVWYVPPQLEKAMPKFWAYALLAFLIYNAIYFVPPLDGGRRTTVWWKWCVSGFVFAVILTLLVTYL